MVTPRLAEQLLVTATSTAIYAPEATRVGEKEAPPTATEHRPIEIVAFLSVAEPTGVFAPPLSTAESVTVIVAQLDICWFALRKSDAPTMDSSVVSVEKGSAVNVGNATVLVLGTDI